MFLRKLLYAAAAFTILLQICGATSAEDWPQRPVTMVVPFAAGGAVDATARNLAPRLSQVLGQQVVVENVPGAGGMTAAARVAGSSADGYRFLLGNTSTHAINQTLYKKPPYNAATDFVPVGMIAQTSMVLIVRKGIPVSTLPEFISFAKANSAKMQYASAGAGTITHLACVLLNGRMSVDIAHIPYRGTAMAMQDMLGGRIDFMCDSVAAAQSQIQTNSVKAIAALGASRIPALPDLATATEQGMPQFVISPWHALFLPKGTPETIARRLSTAVSESLDTPSVRERLEAVGSVIPARENRSPEYLARLVPAEIEKWATPISASGLSGSM